LPLRSLTLPTQAIASSIAVRAGPASADAGMMMPSPLSTVSANALVTAMVSSIEIASASFLPRSASMRLAAATTFASESAARLTSSRLVSSSLGFLNHCLMSAIAARMSCTRMRPSLFASRSSRVAGSISTSFVGIASATHNFWSRSGNASRSNPSRSET